MVYIKSGSNGSADCLMFPMQSMSHRFVGSQKKIKNSTWRPFYNSQKKRTYTHTPFKLVISRKTTKIKGVDQEVKKIKEEKR